MLVYLIVGLGGVGSLLAYFLNRAGYRPYAITRTHYDHYYLCIGEDCHEVEVDFNVERDKVEYTLLAVKAPDTEDALKHAVGKVVVFQNGIGGYELAKSLGYDAYPAVVTYGVTRIGCKSYLRGIGEIILPRGLERLADDLKRGGANVRIVDDIERHRWLKLLINIVVNPITAILGVKNGYILENDELLNLARMILQEAIQVAHKAGHRLNLDDVWKLLIDVLKATYDNKSSMLQDIEACRATEIEFLNGYLARIGEALGVDVRLNKALYLLVKSLERLCKTRPPPRDTTRECNP